MKALYESLLDDEEQLSKSIDRALITAESIINSKTQEEFNTKIELLKEKFDKEYGGTERDYYKALEIGQRGGKTKIFAIEKFIYRGKDKYNLIIETGPQAIHIITFDPQAKVYAYLEHYKGLEDYCNSKRLLYLSYSDYKMYIYDDSINIYLLDYKKYNQFWSKLANI